MSEIIFPEWRKQNETTKFPFTQNATLTNDEVVLVEGTFIDACLYPVGSTGGLFLSSVIVTNDTVTLVLGDRDNDELATGVFDVADAPNQVDFYDEYNRPAGVLLTESYRLGVFQAWGTGTHVFEQEQTEFCATCVIPTPEVGVRAIRLETGELFTGDIWLVGADGVLFRHQEVTVPADRTNPERVLRAIRIDVIGDPLFRRRLCVPNNLFSTPRFVKKVHVIGPNGESFDCYPDELGNVQILAGNDLAADTVLRIVPVAGGLSFGAVGSLVDD